MFSQFKSVGKKYFNLLLVPLYSDNDGKFIKLRLCLLNNVISYYTTPLHTLELNAIAERHHCHIIEPDQALLHQAKLPLEFWSFAFKTTTYLINRLPTPILNMQSPYQLLHKTNVNPNHLHSFD